MAIRSIQVLEYECVHCGYKWTNRVNGREGSVPRNCAKCKRRYWNGQGKDNEYTPISPTERGLRRRLCRFEGYDPRKGTPYGRSTSYRPNELYKKFLNLSPRPTMSELKRALMPLGWDPRRHTNYVPNADEPGYLKYNADGKGYNKLLKEEPQKRKEIMHEIIKNRNKDD
jgi:hypothetical protein